MNLQGESAAVLIVCERTYPSYQGILHLHFRISAKSLKLIHVKCLYGCLSVHRHNVSPRFYNRCLSQATTVFANFQATRTRVNLRNTIVYRDISSNVKHHVFSKVLVKCRQNVTNKLFVSRYFNPVDPCILATT